MLVRSELFEAFILGIILMNTICLALTWYGQDEKWAYSFKIINYCFLTIFTLEAILKLYAFKKRFFRDGWNIFDLVVVVGAYIGLLTSGHQ
jgi:hypothetical protein